MEILIEKEVRLTREDFARILSDRLGYTVEADGLRFRFGLEVYDIDEISFKTSTLAKGCPLPATDSE